jgi:flagellar basal-body rod protein FlgC
MSLSNVFDIAGSGMNAQSIRINTTASNIANAESASSSVDETYRARKPWFAVMHKSFMEVNANNEFQSIEDSTGAGDGYCRKRCAAAATLSAGSSDGE